MITRAMPRRFAPYVQSPIVGVISMMPGLSAQEMELYVSKPIEEQLVKIIAASSASLAWSECGQPLATTLAARGFRRPLREGEIEEYRTLFERVWEAAQPVPELDASHEALTASE